MNIYGQRLKDLREQNGYTQEELAKKLHTSRSRIAMYERCNRQPDFEMQEAIADFFNVSIDYLFGREKSIEYNLSPTLKAIEKTLSNNTNLSSDRFLSNEETIVILAYRNADDIGKTAVKRILGIEEERKKDDLHA